MTVPVKLFDSLIVTASNYSEALAREQKLIRDTVRLRNEIDAKEVRFVRQIGYTKRFDSLYKACQENSQFKNQIIARTDKPEKRFYIGPSVTYGVRVPEFKPSFVIGGSIIYKLFGW